MWRSEIRMYPAPTGHFLLLLLSSHFCLDYLRDWALGRLISDLPILCYWFGFCTDGDITGFRLLLPKKGFPFPPLLKKIPTLGTPTLFCVLYEIFWALLVTMTCCPCYKPLHLPIWHIWLELVIECSLLGWVTDPRHSPVAGIRWAGHSWCSWQPSPQPPACNLLWLDYFWIWMWLSSGRLLNLYSKATSLARWWSWAA